MAPWIDVAGWTLLHFVWQGAAIAVVAAFGFFLLRAAAPHVRYALASVAMATMLVAPVATAMRLSSTTAVADPPRSTSAISIAPALPPDAAGDRHVAGAPRIPAKARPGLKAVLPVIVMLWLTGVALLQLRLLGGWWRVKGLHRASLAGPASEWQAKAESLAARLGVRQLVRVVEAHAVEIPSVIGWWRPVILLPMGALAGLTPAQADAILVHELAHIRRHDYLVNGLQHVAETLLFYHPAVWWISRRMRIEREHCCDALVVRVCGDPVEYAVALVELEAGRSRRTALGVAATDGSLVQRIRVLLSAQPSHRRPLADALVTAFVVAVLVVVTGGGYRWAVRANVAEAPRVAQASPGADALLVTVNGEAITDGDLQRRQIFNHAPPGAALSAALAAAIDERLIVQRGRQLGMGLSDEQVESALRVRLRTNPWLRDALATQPFTLADIRRNLEAQLMPFYMRFDLTPAPVTDQEAQEYFAAHVQAFPLQTLDLARAQIEEQLAWDRLLQMLRTEAVLVWQRPDLRRAYEAFRAQSPQGRADVPQPAPATPRASDWQVYATDHFEIFFKGLTADARRAEHEAERAYQRLSSDLRHDLSTRPSLVLFATSAERDRVVAQGVLPGALPGMQSKILLALDRPDDRFRADIAHEVTHEFEFDILPTPVLHDSPAWMLEGLAEREGELWTAGDDELLRGLVRADRVPSLSAFEPTAEHRLPYAVGHAAFDFIAARWGLDGIRQMFFSIRQRQAADRGGLYHAAFGISAEQFDQSFERYLRDRFPSVSAAPPVHAPERVTLTVPLSYRDNQIVFVGDEPIRMAELEERLRRRMDAVARKEVLLSGDGALKLSEVIAIFEVLKAAGVDHVAVEDDVHAAGAPDGRRDP